ncbi:MAG: IS1380 family transposase, partial [Gallionellales bacterium CG03_land_8_20_14_0_80_55_15]
YVLHQQLRQLGLQGTRLASAQPKTVILSLFKIAVRVKPYKDRVLLHLATACPVKSIRAQVCQRLCPAGRKPAMRASP